MNSEWKNEGHGYFSMVAKNSYGYTVAYLALPSRHPLAFVPHVLSDERYAPDVHGGITFCRANIVGWDYQHGWETGLENPRIDIEKAMNHYRKLQ